MHQKAEHDHRADVPGAETTDAVIWHVLPQAVAVHHRLFEKNPRIEEREPDSNGDDARYSGFVRVHARKDAASSRLEVKRLMPTSTIGEVAARTGLRASAIRYYEEQGLLPAAERRGGKRVYDSSIFQRIAIINLAKAAGFSLSEIRVVLTSTDASQPRTTWSGLAKAKRAEIERELELLSLRKRIVTALAQCRCASLADCGQAFADALAKDGASG
jgi:MerR family transcriptional regulator, redox-sensitive transcriptional activator SoxR